MKALVKYGQRDGEVELRDVPEPVIGPDDILLQVRAAGICGWDIEMWRHKMANPVSVPVIQGHEFAGVIKAMGDCVQGFAPGDRVVSETAAVVCGTCALCRTGNYQLCPDRKGFGYGVDGAFTRYVRVPQRCLHRIPNEMPFEHASIIEPVCVAYHALVVQSRIEPGSPVVVIGPGPVGLFCLQIARACGAGPIIVVGAQGDDLRFEVAGKLGAERIINASLENPMAVIDQLTNGMGAPLVVDAAGNEHAVALAMHAVSRGGQITKIGWGPKPLNLSLDPLLSKSVRLQGSFSHSWKTWEAVIAMIQSNAVKMEPMITRRVRLDQWLETFEAIEAKHIVKAVFTMEDV